MSTYATIDFLAVWEELHNPDFNRMEFQSVRSEPGRLIMTPKKWIELTGSIGITSKTGRLGGTYAHTDIAFEFASWISPEFKLYIIKDYQRLKKDEASRTAIGWDEKRALSKLNYHIHTDAIQQYLIDEELTPQERNLMFSSEGDLLNLALFGKKAWEWRKTHPEESKRGENIRDYASAEELVVLINLESLHKHVTLCLEKILLSFLDFGFIVAEFGFINIHQKSIGAGDIGSCSHGELKNLHGIFISALVVQFLAPFLKSYDHGGIVLIILSEDSDVGCSILQLKVCVCDAGKIYYFFIFKCKQIIFGALKNGVITCCPER